MPSGLRKTTGNHFEIYYEQPWGGVASNANPVDIQPNQLVTSQGVVCNNGELNYVDIVAPANGNFVFHPYVTNAVICTIFTQSGNYYAVDQFGYMYQNTNGGAGFVYICTASDGPWSFSSAIPTIAVRVINSIAYISVFARNSIYSYNGATAFTLGSNYVGGLVLGVLDDYLLMLNCNQAAGGPNSSIISWSGPGEFTTWNPSTNQLAGYNQVASVEDQFTGFLSFSSVGVAISAKSLTELSPTGVGIGPFSFTPLWTSVVGQGCVYPFTVTQYGQNGYIVTDSGAYTISASAGFSDITGAAKEAFLSSFQSPSGANAGEVNAVAADMLLEFTGSKYATPYYIVAAPILSGNSGEFYNLWMYDLQGSGWYNVIFNTITLCNTQNGTNYTNANPLTMNVVTMQQLEPNSYTFGSSFPPVTLIYYTVYEQTGNLYTTTVAQVAVKNSQSAPTTLNAGNLNLVFRQEEIKLGRKPTIRRILIKAYGSGTLNLSVSGVNFGSVVLNGSNTPATYESTMNMYTGEDPQLTITSTNFLGSIIKIMLGGTYADGDVD